MTNRERRNRMGKEYAIPPRTRSTSTASRYACAGPTCALPFPRIVAGRFHRHILPLYASMVTARF
ncbi:hypothetical protein [Nitrosomonas sp. Nm34]|uniref:hypothetical protein n=1 Tax=Nitrosomonas sp. Nm34 TaxID=1881055 RepID=UPI0011141658|nr:hypothetical protein [Nitrosomonas sp. Nm34]